MKPLIYKALPHPKWIVQFNRGPGCLVRRVFDSWPEAISWVINNESQLYRG
jgi:hypothetical protein